MENISRKDAETEKEVRAIIGNALRRLRQANGLSLAQAAELTGSTPERLSQLEDGDKGLNSVRMVQHIATIGGRLTITPAKGEPIEVNAPPFTDNQKGYNQYQREESLRHNEAVRELNRMFGNSANQKTDESTPPIKKRRPRIIPPNQKTDL